MRPGLSEKTRKAFFFFFLLIFRIAVCDLKIKVVKKKKRSWGIVDFSFANILESSLYVQNVKGT